MLTIHSSDHVLHAPANYFARGCMVPSREKPERAEILLSAARTFGCEMKLARTHSVEEILATHRCDYVGFLRTAYDKWTELGLGGPGSNVLPHNYAIGYDGGPPAHFEAQLGYYMSGGNVPITQGTWSAAKASTFVALDGAIALLEGSGEAYALCRPPGHHAQSALAGGFCYLNNAAIAANKLRSVYDRVAILDIDVHHGNGTQEIFYSRSDVYFVSLHADPERAFPWYAGFKREAGSGEGLGKTLNVPLELMTGDDDYLAALDFALGAIRAYNPQALVVSLGFDIHHDDPSKLLGVSTPGFQAIGARIGALDLPILLVQEGGYDVYALEANLHSFLNGFLSSRPN